MARDAYFLASLFEKAIPYLRRPKSRFPIEQGESWRRKIDFRLGGTFKSNDGVELVVVVLSWQSSLFLAKMQFVFFRSQRNERRQNSQLRKAEKSRKLRQRHLTLQPVALQADFGAVGQTGNRNGKILTKRFEGNRSALNQLFAVLPGCLSSKAAAEKRKERREREEKLLFFLIKCSSYFFSFSFFPPLAKKYIINRNIFFHGLKTNGFVCESFPDRADFGSGVRKRLKVWSY